MPHDVAVGDDTMMAVDQVQAALPGSCGEALTAHLALLHTDSRVEATHHAVCCRTYLACGDWTTKLGLRNQGFCQRDYDVAST